MDVDITTDADRLISILKTAPGKMFTLAELAASLGTPEKNVKKYVQSLEEQGKVRVNYSMTQIMASWILPPEEEIAEAKEMNIRASEAADDSGKENVDAAFVRMKKYKQLLDEKRKLQDELSRLGVDDKAYSHAGGIAPSAPAAAPATNKPFSEDDDIVTEEKIGKMIDEIRDSIREEEKEARLEADLKEGETGGESAGGAFGEMTVAEEDGSRAENPAPEIIPVEKIDSAEKVRENAGPAIMPSEKAGSQEIEKPAAPGIIPSDSNEIEAAEETPSSFEKAAFIPQIKPMPMPKKDAALERFSGKLAAHMARISAKAKEIERIKLEKRRLLHEVYAPLQSKVQGELEDISDRILDHEKRLLELREHVAGLPGQVADISGRHEKMASLAHEMQKAYDETTNMTEEALKAVLEAKETAEIKAGEIRSMALEQDTALSSLKGEFARLSDMEKEAEEKIAEAQSEIDHQQQALSLAGENLSAISGKKKEMAQQISEVKRGIETQNSSLAELDSHLERLGRVAQYVNESRSDYEKKMQQLAEYVSKGESEYAALREDVEANFIRKFLKHLRSVSESYEFELSQAKQSEMEIDREIEKAKGELGALIEEGKRLAQLHEMQLEDSETAPSAGGQEMKMLASIGSSLKEQSRIRDYIRKSIEGESARKSQPAAKPSQKRTTFAQKAKKKALKKRGRGKGN